MADQPAVCVAVGGGDSGHGSDGALPSNAGGVLEGIAPSMPGEALPSIRGALHTTFFRVAQAALLCDNVESINPCACGGENPMKP